jgi:DNA polymerase-4
MFYVQVARLEDPEGAGKQSHLIVGGASGRGVVTSASYEARAFGVTSAMPTARALQLCPLGVVVPVPREACMERSRAIREALISLAPVVQSASIDEFYLDMSGTERMLHDEPLSTTATRIREEVLDRTGISVSIGGGTRKLIAKLATGLAKPAGVRIVEAGREEEFMRQFQLAQIPGVGPALVDTLSQRGLVTVDDALAVDASWLNQWLGEGRGHWLYERIRGHDTSRVDGREPRKSISSERTFFEDMVDEQALERELLKLTVSVCSSLRRGKLQARTVTVKVRDSDFTTRQGSRTLPEPIESDQAVFGVARELMTVLRERRRRPTRLLGVGLTNLTQRGFPNQLALFEAPGAVEGKRERDVARTVDGIRERFGDRALLPGRIMRPPTGDKE